MPTISDPGYKLIKLAVEHNLTVEVVPGPTALTAAVALAALPADKFVFEGFLPAEEKQKEQRLKELVFEDRTLVFYEAPHRLKKTLVSLLSIFGERQCFVARELTKKYEEHFRGTIADVLALFQKKEPKGEFVLVVGAAPKSDDKKESVTLGTLDHYKLAELLKAKNLSNKDIVDIIAELTELPRNVLKKEIFC